MNDLLPAIGLLSSLIGCLALWACVEMGDRYYRFPIRSAVWTVGGFVSFLSFVAISVVALLS